MSLDQDRRLSACRRDKMADSPGAAAPLQGLKVASHAALEDAQQRGRLRCRRCGASRMFFCYTCCSLVGVSPQDVPVVKLPVKIDIIKHPNETDGKSTAIHAKILAPDDVTIYTYPCIPEFNTDQVVLVFPGPAAVSVQDLVQRLLDRSHDSLHERRTKRLKTEEHQDASSALGGAPQGGAPQGGAPQGGAPQGGAPQGGAQTCPLQRVVFIDSTWNQTNKISTDERLQGLLQVELTSRKTCFWRRQKGKPDSFLSTIEAVYYFLRDFHQHCLAQQYSGEYDNLFFFYTFLHSIVSRAKTLAAKT